MGCVCVHIVYIHTYNPFMWFCFGLSNAHFPCVEGMSSMIDTKISILTPPFIKIKNLEVKFFIWLLQIQESTLLYWWIFSRKGSETLFHQQWGLGKKKKSCVVIFHCNSMFCHGHQFLVPEDSILHTTFPKGFKNSFLVNFQIKIIFFCLPQAIAKQAESSTLLLGSPYSEITPL